MIMAESLSEYRKPDILGGCRSIQAELRALTNASPSTIINLQLSCCGHHAPGCSAPNTPAVLGLSRSGERLGASHCFTPQRTMFYPQPTISLTLTVAPEAVSRALDSLHFIILEQGDCSSLLLSSTHRTAVQTAQDLSRGSCGKAETRSKTAPACFTLNG